ncbi:hypothetical protein [Streptomyces tirandamycinicus]|uniref:hypothetical protein n=1 Tax=Streptomyces tirandamycinicus TaxID=2174846 RepID=UPI003F4DDF45
MAIKSSLDTESPYTPLDVHLVSHPWPVGITTTRDFAAPRCHLLNGFSRISSEESVGVTDGTGRRDSLAFVVGVVGGRGDLAVVVSKDPADQLDAAEAVPVLADERYESVCGRSSSAARKRAADLGLSIGTTSPAL